MWRPMLIVGLVGLLMVGGAALAAPSGETRLPVTMVSAQAPSPARNSEVVVERGDHLWKISKRHLYTHSPDEAIAPYWLRVIDVNTPSLRSGDPDLIYPGEVILLPEVSERP